MYILDIFTLLIITFLAKNSVFNYFLAKNEYSESKKYYSQILSLKNLHQEMYEQARSKLVLIQNE